MTALLALLALGQTMNLNGAGTVQVSPPPAVGAFGAALGVQETVPLDLSFPYNLLDPIVVVTNTDAGTITADGGHAILTVGTTGHAEMRSRLSARYVPGQGLSTRFTFVADKPCHSNQTMEVGAGDDTDGFAFGCCMSCSPDGGPSFGALRRSSGVDNWIPVERFNGPWGRVAPDITYGRPYQIAWQWLGYGQVTWSIENATTGAFQVAHSLRYAGTATETSVSNATMPLHAHVHSTGADAGLVLRVPSMSIVRQGEEPTTGRRYSATASRAISTTSTQVLAIRSESAFNGRVNRTPVRADFLAWSVSPTTNADAIIKLRLNPTQNGAGYVATNTYSSVKYDPDGGIGADLGTEIMSLVAENGASGTVDLRPYEIHLAPTDILLISGQSTSGTPTLRISLSWVEER